MPGAGIPHKVKVKSLIQYIAKINHFKINFLFPYLRYDPGFNPTAEYSLNGVLAPACDTPPACSGLTTAAPSSAAAVDDHGCTSTGTCPEGTMCTVTGMSDPALRTSN